MAMHVPNLDPGVMLSAQRTFFRTVFRAKRSNRLSVELLARHYPRKEYRMKITVQRPQPALLRWPLLRRFLFDTIFWKLLRRGLQTSLTIEME
jgi:hypothetical protein